MNDINPPHYDADTIKGFIDREKYWKGAFEKLGGGLSRDLSEALVIGWNPASHKRWSRPEYQLVEVRIVLDE